MNGVTHLVFNKVDVLRAVQRWAVIDKNKVIKFKSEKAMKDFLFNRLKELGLSKIMSSSPNQKRRFDILLR